MSKQQSLSLGIDMPAGWDLETVASLTLEHKQGYYTKEAYNDEGTYLIRITDLLNPKITFTNMPKVHIDEKTYEQFKLEDNDFLFARSGAIGRYGIYREGYPEAIFASYLIRFKFNTEKLNNRYFGYFYESSFARRQIERITQGSSNININANNIKSLVVPLPSLSEQHKIAEILFSVDEAIEKTEAIIEQTEEVKKGLMQQLLTKGIGHENFKKTDIGQIPDEWEVVKMGDVIELISGQSSSINEINYERKGIAYVTGPEQWNGYHIEETKWVEKPRKIAKENSIFITVKGSGVGTIFLGGYYAIGRDVMAIVPLENINKDYLYYLALYQARKIVYNKVGMVPGISRGDILEFKFGLPKIDEQVRISKVLTSWDKKLTIEKNKRLKLRELKNGLMQSLLTGKVRVKVNEAEVTQL